MKKGIAVFLLFGIVLCLFACAKQEERPADDTGTPVATVNGEDITAEELTYFQGKLKAQVMNDYLEKYSITYTDGFWTTEYDGKTPEKDLQEQALEKCILAKIQLILMREKGIYDDISYKGLRNKAIAFNEENKEKANVVGLKTIQMSRFYSYYLDNGIMELCNRMAEKELKPSESEIKEKINALKQAGDHEAEQEELEAIAVNQIVSEKYDAYIHSLYKEADIVVQNKDL